MPLSRGTRLGPYEVVTRLGAGGMGEVYQARDSRLDRTVALKVLPEGLSRDAVLRQRLEREARAISKLSHPHICTLYDVGQHGDRDYLVMEYVAGETLAQRLERGPLGAEQLLQFAAQIADALANAHRQDIVHRDLKPGNIMLSPTGAKLLDFGLAKAVAVFPPERNLSGATTESLAPAPLTIEGSIVGTYYYMSPEQLEGRETDARCDIFSLGVVMYEMAAGSRPFQGSSPASVMAAILRGEPAPLPPSVAGAPAVAAELNRIVRKCLRKRPEERYLSAADLLVDLQNLRRDSSERLPAVSIEEEADEPSLVARALGVFGRSPRLWWELHNLGAIFLFFPSFTYLGWKVAGGGITRWLGLMALSAAISIVLRGYLLITAAFNPRALRDQVRKVSPGVYASTALFMGLLVLTGMNGWELGDFLPLVAVILGICGALVSVTIEPAIVRAAFPRMRSQAELARPPEVQKHLKLVVVLQIAFHLPVAVLAGDATFAGGLDPARLPWSIAGFLFFLGAGVSAGLGIELVRAKLTAPAQFLKAFWGLVLVDALGIFLVLATGGDAIRDIPVPVVITVAVVVIVARFYQRRLATRTLGNE